MYILLLHVLLTECLGLILNTTKDGKSTFLVLPHMTADFGISFSDSSYERSAPLIAIEPEDGCNGIENGAELAGKIVIVKRGQCSFFQKAWNVDYNNGKGLVVGNNKGDDLVHMYKPVDTKAEVNIPCVFVSESDYNLSIEALSQANCVIATISPSEEYPISNIWPPRGLITIIINMLLTFLLPCAVLVLLWACYRNRKWRTAKMQVRAIPEVIFISEKLEAKGMKLTNDSCPICLADFKEQTRIKLLPCNHGFHPECIEPWVRQHNDSCPMCRETVADELKPPQRDATCCYNINSKRRLTASSNQSSVDDLNLHEGQQMENSSATASGEHFNRNRGQQPVELNDLNDSIPLEGEAAELTL